MKNIVSIRLTYYFCFSTFNSRRISIRTWCCFWFILSNQTFIQSMKNNEIKPKLMKLKWEDKKHVIWNRKICYQISMLHWVKKSKIIGFDLCVNPQKDPILEEDMSCDYSFMVSNIRDMGKAICSNYHFWWKSVLCLIISRKGANKVMEECRGKLNRNILEKSNLPSIPKRIILDGYHLLSEEKEDNSWDFMIMKYFDCQIVHVLCLAFCTFLLDFIFGDTWVAFLICTEHSVHFLYTAEHLVARQN